jgi:hypothetical protein
VLELVGRLVLIPIHNVRTVEVFPAPDNLPPDVVRGARIMQGQLNECC